MPTYEYICEKCGHEFDVFQSISAPPLRICPAEQCARKKWGRGRVKRKIVAGGGLLFKGSGFYTTDYRSEGYRKAAQKDTPAAKTSGAKSQPSESQPAPAKPAVPTPKK